MSRVINIKGKVIIQNIKIAREAINELNAHVQIKNNQFIFNQYDYYDEISEKEKLKEMEALENLYQEKFHSYLQEIEEKERFRIEEEKRLQREEKMNLIMANAKKYGYKLKKEIREDNTIKLVLQKRVY